jgi:outer membrane protein insertion porin family
MTVLNMQRFIFILLAVLLIPAWPRSLQARPWNGEAVRVDAVIIEVTDPYAHGFDWPGLARALIGLARGDQLTAARLKQSVDALESLANVRTDVVYTGQGAVVTFKIRPYQRIESIDIDGSYPLFDSDVLKVMTLTQGDVFRPQMAADQAALIAQRYRDEGYIDPQVTMTWTQDARRGFYHLQVKIQNGAAYVLNRIKITGNHRIPDVVLMGLMHTWRQPAVWIGAGRFVAADLKADIQRLTAHYRSQGFADVRIDSAVHPDPQRRQVQATITIDEGPRYRIDFSGNRFFSDAFLRRDLELFTGGNRGNTGLRRSILDIRRRYLQAGFADVHVSRPEIEEHQEPPAEKIVHIRITEGLRHIVERVEIHGARRVDSRRIRAQMLTRPAGVLGNGAYVASVLQEDVAAVRALYQQEGFLNPRITDNVAVDDRTGKVIVTFEIEEGVQTLVGLVRIQGPSPVVDQLPAGAQLKPGHVFQPSGVTDDEDLIAAQISKQGYPYILVRSQVDMAADRSRADLVYHVDPGPYVEVGRIFWAGNFMTRRTLLESRLKLKPGAPFSLAAVLEAQRRLRELDLFQSVRVRSIGLKEKAAKVHLLITMKEKPAHSFELGGGYETDKGFYGRTKVADNNFMGTGKSLRLAGEQSQVGYRWEAGGADPRILGTDVSADLGLFIENQEAFNQDFGYDTWGGKLTFSRPWGPQFTTALGFSYERRHQYLREQDVTSTAVDPQTLEPRAILVTTPMIRWDTRDSFIQPNRGGLASLAVDFSRGLESSLDNFVKYKLDLRGYHTLYPRLTLAGRAFAGYIQPYGADGQIPEDQLFFLGGTNSVRGFAENMLRFSVDQDPVGGRLALSGSVEARYNLIGNWELTIFVDAGSVQKSVDDQGSDDWRYATGLGLRYRTPIGPIGLLYGRKLNPRPGESSGQFHLSVGYTF